MTALEKQDVLKSKKKSNISPQELNSNQKFIIGIDEAGRGPLAGPVVASAVSLKSHDFLNQIGDSKKISPHAREKAFIEIYEKAYVGIGIINEAVIDQVNILQATYLAMNNAVRALLETIPTDLRGRLSRENVIMRIDGNSFKSQHPFPYETIVKGDQTDMSISCASIIAKVMRDRILKTYDKVFPQYGFKRHKGYPTKAHKEVLHQIGPCLIHRRSFQY